MSELALQLIAKEKIERTGKLDLGNCGLTDFPEELFELEWLEELNFCDKYFDDEKQDWIISSNIGKGNRIEQLQLPETFALFQQLKTFRIGGDYIDRCKITDCTILGKIQSLTNLFLSSNQISDIRFLEKMTCLTNLDLSDNQISEIHFLEKLTGLISLDLRNNQISDISALEKLTCLTSLDLNRNQISDISILEKLTGLTSLYFSGNQISDIRFLEKLTGLTDLKLNYNEISDNSILENLTNLNSLDLATNKISDIRFLEHLTGLTSLGLRGNQISDISILEKLTNLNNLDLDTNKISNISGLKKLTGLTFLSLSSNQINDISSLEKLTGLTYLILSGNQISDISVLRKLTGLTNLVLSRNQISDYSFLEKLTDLINLDLSSNQISDISILGKLTSFKNLDLSFNKISNIERLIPLMKKGLHVHILPFSDSGINLYDNPIVNPPIAIVEQGTESILDWFAQIDETGAEPFYESKLMILGQGGAGKTTFAKLLLDPTHEVKPGKLDTTIGIVVNRGKEFPNAEKEKSSIKAHLWDFGGQNIQKMLHQFFITENCLYVLVSDKRAENTNFDYWFQIINLLGPKSSVIVLENPKEAKHANESFALQKYRELYPDLTIESIEVNLNATRGRHKKRWEGLNEMISEKLSEIELVNRMVPLKWGLVRDALEQKKGEKYIRKDEFYKICENPEIGFNKRQADWCLSYFRSLGDLVYFDDRDLCTHIFLDQNWLTQGLYYILSDKKIEEDGGRFTLDQAFTKWDSNRYTEEEKVMLINLLLKDKFDICYELPENKNVFITPLLLPTDKPKSKWEHETQLRFRYQYGFIPHGLFSRLIVQLHEKIDSELHWKTGVWLKDTVDGKGVYAEVQQYTDPEENQPVIDIKISGEKNGCKQMLAFIRAAVDKLHKDFRNINVKQMVACNCDTCTKRRKEGGKISFYDYGKLQKKVLNKNYFEECEESNYQKVNIGQILNDMILENAANDNIDSSFFNRLKEIGVNFNQINNKNEMNMSDFGKSSSNSSSQSSSEATATNEVTISINNILGEVQNLKENFEDKKKIILKTLDEDDYESAKLDIEKTEKAIQEIENARQSNASLPPKAVSRLKQFVDDALDEESSLNKGLKVLRKGRDYAVNLAELYNKVAANSGMPLVPPLALDVIKKL
jgi:Leucine-rich repeat (LRR) protein/GTPase SAR1 family protein